MMRRAVLSVVVACALVGCSTPQDDPVTPIDTSSAEPTVEATPTEVGFGDAESVTWAPTADVSGELSISVEKVRAGDFEDFVGLEGSGITDANQPFYVDVLISNEGDADLGGFDVPLYLEDSNATLSPPWGFAEPFKPCKSGPLPDPFATGDEADMCLVFFGSPDATFESITFQPTLETPAVKWTGEVAVHAKSGKKASKGSKKRR